MPRIRIAYVSVFLLVLICCLVVPIRAAEQSGSTNAGDQIGSTAYAAQSTYKLLVGAGIGFFEMDNLNTYYIDGFAKPFGLFSNNVEYGLCISFALERRISQQIAVGIGFHYLHSSLDAGEPVYHDWRGDKLSVDGFIPLARLTWHTRTSPVNFKLGLEGLVCFGRCEVRRWEVVGAGAEGQLSNVGYRSTATGFGLGVLCGPAVHLSRVIAVAADFGYRYLETGTLTNDNGDWIVDASTAFGEGPITLDFSGVYVTLSLEYSL